VKAYWETECGSGYARLGGEAMMASDIPKEKLMISYDM
jgi:hypothetical protein